MTEGSRTQLFTIVHSKKNLNILIENKFIDMFALDSENSNN